MLDDDQVLRAGRTLDAILGAIERGELQSTPAQVARLQGARDALLELSHPTPVREGDV